jgi:hypothetical protein
VIDRCDYYVIVLGGRYGTVDSDGLSYTEKEYQYALSRKIPVLPFLVRDPNRREARHVDTDPVLVSKLANLRDRLSQSQMVDFWDDAAGLAVSVAVALQQEINLNPGIGWVRGDLAVDPMLYQELEEARKELSILRTSLGSEEPEISFPKDIAAIDEEFEATVPVVVHPSDGTGGIQKTLTFSESWRAAFLSVADELFSGGDEIGTARRIISMALMRRGAIDSTVYLGFGEIDHVVSMLRVQFEALGLVKTATRTEAQEHVYGTKYSIINVWSLTDKGRRFLARSLAIRPATIIPAVA